MPFKETKAGKPTGRWIAKLVINGEQVWLGRHDTKADARAAEDQERAKRTLLKRGKDFETCGSFADRWTTDYPRPKESTNRHNAERVRKFADEFKKIRLVDVDRPMARAWAMRNPERLSAVRAMFTDAANDGIIEKNPFAGLRIQRKESGRKGLKVLTRDELYELADTAPAALGEYGHEFRSLLLFAAFTGCRPGELMLLRREDLNIPFAHVTRQLTKFGDVTTPKNGKSRVVTVPPPARDAVRGLLERDGVIFRSKTGKPLTHGTLFYAWDKVRNVAGKPGLDFYEVTRHFCATYLLEIGVSHADVAVQLGHTDGGALVMSTYGHPSEDGARQRVLSAFEQVAGENVVPLRKVSGDA